ncbi:hypothetical protein FRC07_013421, partial [Ceratobasidium sp. 392]
MLLAKQHGEIYKLNMLGKQVIVMTNVALAQEVLDKKRFHKGRPPALLEVDKIDRILMPIFGPLSIRAMFDDMYDILSQLCLKWERFGPMHPIKATGDLTGLALDTICAYNYRLNKFYSLEDPPFVKAMGDFLAKAQYAEDMAIMQKLADEIIEDRRKHPIEKKDLLNAMFSGQGFTDKNIQAQMLTFLIAGHETTSGMLAFAMTHILSNPN